MFGPKVHLFAAAVALTFGGATGASAGLFDNGGCCAPTTWGCQSTCGNIPNVIYGTIPAPLPDYYPPPVYPVNQGPVYEPPVLPYGEPQYEPQDNTGQYPYVAPYGGGGYPYYVPGYRRHGFHGYRHFHRFGGSGHRYGVHGYRRFGVGGYRPLFHGNRGGYHQRFGGNRTFVRRGPMGHGRRW